MSSFYQTSSVRFEGLESRTMMSAAPAAQLIRLDSKIPTALADGRVPSVWIVIPGMGGSPTGPIKDVAAALDGASSNDRVFLLDWRNSGKSLGGNADLVKIATATINQLKGLGIGTRQLNIVGYSLGSPIAAKICEMVNHGRQQVQTLVTLDPAAPRGSNPGGADHGRPIYTLGNKARFSIAFYTGAVYSWAPRATSAQVTIKVDGLGSNDLAKHTNIPTFFASMIRKSNVVSGLTGAPADQISSLFSAKRLSEPSAWPWKTNAYSGVYEGILTAKYQSNAFAPASLNYIDRSTGKTVTE